MGIKSTFKNQKMKFSALLSTLAIAQEDSSNGTELAERGRVPSQEQGSKRYSQLVEMMGNYNTAFDERKYWTYGCNCLILGDRPMSDPGHGKPVDELDTVCKAYKDCLKCARWAYGDMCIGEFVQYKYGIKGGQVKCRNKENSCDRALCECDRQFAIVHNAAKQVYTNDYHSFWSELGWDPEGQCQKGGNGKGGNPQCCGGGTTAYTLYNADKKDCCNDGSVAPAGTC